MVRVWTARRKASQSGGQIYLHCQREHGIAVGSSTDTFGSSSPTVFFCLYSLDKPWKQTRNILQHERRKKKKNPQDSQNKVALLLKLCTNSHFLLMQNAHTNVVHCEVVVQHQLRNVSRNATHWNIINGPVSEMWELKGAHIKVQQQAWLFSAWANLICSINLAFTTQPLNRRRTRMYSLKTQLP